MRTTHDLLDSYIEQVVKRASRDIVEDGGAVEPIVFCLTMKDGLLEHVDAALLKVDGNPAEALLPVLQEFRPDAYAYVAEAWMAESHPEDVGLYESGELRPSERPDRQEAIIITAAVKGDAAVLWSAVIQERKPGGVAAWVLMRGAQGRAAVSQW